MITQTKKFIFTKPNSWPIHNEFNIKWIIRPQFDCSTSGWLFVLRKLINSGNCYFLIYIIQTLPSTTQDYCIKWEKHLKMYTKMPMIIINNIVHAGARHSDNLAVSPFWQSLMCFLSLLVFTFPEFHRSWIIQYVAFGPVLFCLASHIWDLPMLLHIQSFTLLNM